MTVLFISPELERYLRSNEESTTLPSGLATLLQSEIGILDARFTFVSSPIVQYPINVARKPLTNKPSYRDILRSRY